MRKVISWIEDNWEASLALFLLLAVSVYDSLHLIHPGLSFLKADEISYVIMAMLAAVTLMLLRMRKVQESSDINRIVNRLILDHAGQNPFIENRIRAQLEFMKCLENKTFGTTFFDINQLIVAIRCAQKGDQILAIDYGPGWRPKFDRVQDANIEAKKRGVNIIRIFIIPDKIAEKVELAEGLWATMTEQAANGIAVKWVTQEALRRSFPEFDARTRGMFLLEYRAGEHPLLMLDLPNAYIALIDGNDLGFEVYWNGHEEVQKRQSHFRELEGLEIVSQLKDISCKDPIPFQRFPTASSQKSAGTP